MKNLTRHILLVAVALVFLYAGVSKIAEPAAFAVAIDRYRAVPHIFAVLAALYLPWLEITCALALFFTRLRTGALGLLTGCSTVFCVMLTSAIARGLDISCGCFGAEAATGRTALLMSLVRALALLASCAWLLMREMRSASRQVLR